RLVNLKRPELLVIASFAAFVACSGRSSSSSGGGGGSSATLVSISLSPSAPSIQTGGTQQFTATGAFSDNTTENLTSTATWSSSSPSVATISSAGIATGVAAGTTTIK